MEQIITSGKNKQEAIDKALGELGLRRSEVRVEVLEEGSRGFLGMGGKDVKVRVSKTDGEGPLPEDLDAEKVTRGILDPLDIDYKLEVRREEDSFFVKITSKKDEGLLIGRRGQTLDAIKHLVQRILTSQAGQAVAVNLEVGDYRQRREEALEEKAEAVAQKVLESGKSLSLEPMTAQDRRIVHLALADRDDLRTYTAGEGSRRRVIVALGGEEEAGRDDREPVSPYEDIPDPSFRSTSISSMAEPREDHREERRSDRRRGGRRPRRDRDEREPRSERRESRRESRSEDRADRSPDNGSPRRRSRREEGGEGRPRRDEGSEGRPRRRGRGDRQREEGGTRIRKTFKKDDESRVSSPESRTESREPRAASHEPRAASHEPRAASPEPQAPRSKPAPVKVDETEKPFSSDLARSVLGLGEGAGEGKPASKKKRYR